MKMRSTKGWLKFGDPDFILLFAVLLMIWFAGRMLEKFHVVRKGRGKCVTLLLGAAYIVACAIATAVVNP